MSKYDPKHAAFLDSKERKYRLSPEKVISLAELEKKDFVLDLGAGTGFLTFPLSQIVEKGKV
ncbi:MAG: SAM-dependent methyltransferase, partial [Candidatus Thermoplasmatota archaeon]|nr:SAM-dependent methyltransferase [Candidatus Thermoplasmatota archaeon]